MANLLRNGDFEAEWSTEGSHRCLRVLERGEAELVEASPVKTPPGWTVWYRSQEGSWSLPEGGVTSETSPVRMREGTRAYVLQAESIRMDAGLLQQVAVGRGARVRFTIWAHAWSNHRDPDDPDSFPHPDDPQWSEGAGYGSFFSLEGKLESEQDSTRLGNFTFWSGIDPQGGLNPFADSVVWGSGAHIYNAYSQVPAVEATAATDTVTVFVRVRTQHVYNHNRAYLDDARLEPIGGDAASHEPRGRPRIQYERFYVLLPPGADRKWAQAVIEATWDDHRYTVGGSADDAGIGDLDSRIVLVVNPELWGGAGIMRTFFAEHYPGVRYRSVRAGTPEELAELLREV
jgi:hypothetical protein